MMDPTDASLLEASRNGDDTALERLLSRYAPSIHRFGMKMCRDKTDAEDVLQDTLFAAARTIRDFRGASALSTWLYAIARSFCIKKQKRAPATAVDFHDLPDALVESSEESPEDRLGNREIGGALEDAIRALEPMYREVLVLRDVEGLSAAEVAQVLGLHVDAVKSRLHRARVAVRERMAPFLMDDPSPRSSRCPDIVPSLSRYLEGEIGPSDCAAMDAHVKQCARCRAECDSLRKVLALCKTSAKAGKVPEEVQRIVRDAVRQIAVQRDAL